MWAGWVLHCAVCAISTLSGFGSIVIQLGVGVANAESEAVGVPLLEDNFQGVVLAATKRNVTPQDVLILRVASQSLRHAPIEGVIGQRDSASAHASRRIRQTAVRGQCGIRGG